MYWHEVCNWYEAWCNWIHTLSELRLTGLDGVATVLLRSMNMEEVGSEHFRRMLDENSPIAGIFGGAENFKVFGKILDLYVHRDAESTDEVRALLEGREAIFQATNTWASFLIPFSSPVAWAAACLEARGGDALADSYAETSLDRWPKGSSIVRCAHLALRSRVAARRGGRGSAREFARAAVQVAVAEHIPLLAVLTGREFGEEGVMFMEEACKKMGRPLDVVLQELA